MIKCFAQAMHNPDRCLIQVLDLFHAHSRPATAVPELIPARRLVPSYHQAGYVARLLSLVQGRTRYPPNAFSNFSTRIGISRL